jgi:hypothetical protein
VFFRSDKKMADEKKKELSGKQANKKDLQTELVSSVVPNCCLDFLMCT